MAQNMNQSRAQADWEINLQELLKLIQIFQDLQ